MFGFTDMLSTLEERKIGLFEGRSEDGTITLNVSTVLVTDAEEPYETAVSHLDYNAGRWAIVATYPDEEQAALGHAAWIEKMTAKVLPECLVDVGTAEISELCDELDGNTDWRTIKRQEELIPDEHGIVHFKVKRLTRHVAPRRTGGKT